MTSDEEIKYCINTMLSIDDLRYMKELVHQEIVTVTSMPDISGKYTFLYSPWNKSLKEYDSMILERYKEEHHGHLKESDVQYIHLYFCIKKCHIGTIEVLLDRLDKKLNGRVVEGFLTHEGTPLLQLLEADVTLMSIDSIVYSTLPVQNDQLHIIISLCDTQKGNNINEDGWGSRHFYTCFRNLIVYKVGEYTCGEGKEELVVDKTIKLKQAVIDDIENLANKLHCTFNWALYILVLKGINQDIKDRPDFWL